MHPEHLNTSIRDENKIIIIFGDKICQIHFQSIIASHSSTFNEQYQIRVKSRIAIVVVRQLLTINLLQLDFDLT